MTSLAEQIKTKNAIPLLLAATLILCLPFVNKAFHMDDPLFLWVAKQIQKTPLNPYGFQANWYKTLYPMWEITKNPPLTSYYIAFVTSLAGSSETVLHIAFLFSTVLVVFGTYFLACRYCPNPLLATTCGLVTPVFLISSTTIMSDVPMLAFWVWAVYFWDLGLQRNRAFLLVSAILISGSILTKYYGACLIPLLLGFSIVRTKKVDSWAIFLLIPIVFILGYEWLMRKTYGTSLFSDAGLYAILKKNLQPATLTKFLTGLSFTGGCFLPLLFYSHFVWKRHTLVIQSCILILLASVIARTSEIWKLFPFIDESSATLKLTHMIIFSLAGFNALILVSISVWHHRKDPTTFLLFVWVLGTFIFATFLNWSVNGRSLLPMAPALGILIARELEWRKERSKTNFALLGVVIASALLSFFITRADYDFANTTRLAAKQIYSHYVSKQHQLWFQGHWGFQYYMELQGATALNQKDLQLKENDIVVIPENNTNKFEFPISSYLYSNMETFNYVLQFPLATMNWFAGAGFYSDVWGPLPYALGHYPERYYIFKIDLSSNHQRKTR